MAFLTFILNNKALSASIAIGIVLMLWIGALKIETISLKDTISDKQSTIVKLKESYSVCKQDISKHQTIISDQNSTIHEIYGIIGAKDKALEDLSKETDGKVSRYRTLLTECYSRDPKVLEIETIVPVDNCSVKFMKFDENSSGNTLHKILNGVAQ